MTEVDSPSFEMEWEYTHRSREWSAMYDPRLITCVWRRYNFTHSHFQTRILDFGCGVGAQTLEMGRLGYVVLGIDGAPSAIARANELKPTFLNDTVSFAVADVTNIGLQNDFVDCITDVACLEVLDWDNTRKALAEAVRILRAGGCLFSIAKADGWVHTNVGAKVGRGSRALTEQDARELYGEFFARVDLARDSHVDLSGQFVPEWIIQCEGPRK